MTENVKGGRLTLVQDSTNLTREEIDHAIGQMMELRRRLYGDDESAGEPDVGRRLADLARLAMAGPGGEDVTRWRQQLAVTWSMLRALATTPEQHRLADYLGAEFQLSHEDVATIGARVGRRCTPTRIAEIPGGGWGVVRG